MTTLVRYPVHGTTQAPVTQTMRIRTRIHASDADMSVLSALGEHLGHLQGQDLAQRCRTGRSHDKKVWAERKRLLTEQSSSRWAGWVTKTSNDAYATARRNQRRTLADVEKAIGAIEKRLALPVQCADQRKAEPKSENPRRNGKRHSFGYRSAHEHAMKRQRLEHLRSKRDRLQKDVAAGRVHVTRGRKKLLKNRLHLAETGLGEARWRTLWQAKRCSFGANGEGGKRWGNETIRLSPDGTLEVDLPAALAHLANVTVRGTARYRFDARVSFSYHREEWLAHVEEHRAVAYDVVFANGRVYLDASFTPKERVEVPELDALLKDSHLRVLALDLNHGFLAPAVLDRAGNPVQHLPHVPLLTEDLAASTRDGHLRQAVVDVLNLAEEHGCRLVVVENLGFEEMRATGREDYGGAKWFRKVVCAIPTAQVRDRLAAMASRRGIAVAGVPAAYSSIWGAKHWQAPLSTKTNKVSKHTAAAVVLGRRALGHSARRHRQVRSGVTAGDQRVEAALPEPSGGAPVESYHPARAKSQRTRHQAPGKPLRREGSPTRGVTPRRGDVGLPGASPAKTVRAGPVRRDSARADKR